MALRAPRFRIEMLGGFRLVADGRVAARLHPQKPDMLLACLALSPGKSLAREELMEILWPEVDPEAGRNRLKQTLSVLRGELEAVGAGQLIAADRATVRMDATAVETDAALFEERRQSAVVAPTLEEKKAALSAAAQLYGGPLLPGFYEDWALTERERLAQEYVSLLVDLAGAHEAAGEAEHALQAAGKAVAVDCTSEPAHLALMRLYAALGRPADAARQYRDLEHALNDEMGERPSGEAQSLLRAIREGRVTVRARPEAELQRPRAPSTERLEPVGGAVPLASGYYVVRPTDHEFAQAIARQDSLVLVKGPRQVGKTSLLARGLQRARESGARVVLTDLQSLATEQLQLADSLFLALAGAIADQLDMDDSPRRAWDPERGWSVNFERFLRRQVLGTDDSPLVWGLDEVDRLFPYAYAPDVFGLFRSWHNLRALHPGGPWQRLTLAMAHATEAHLFITDLNQSPFNVGTRLQLEDFSLAEVAELNRRYGSPIKDAADVQELYSLVGGNPYLVRRSLHEMVTRRLDLAGMAQAALREDGPFHDHLRRILLLLEADEGLAEAARGLLAGGSSADPACLYRLQSAGVVASTSTGEVRLRCRLYADYLGRRLA